MSVSKQAAIDAVKKIAQNPRETTVGARKFAFRPRVFLFDVNLSLHAKAFQGDRGQLEPTWPIRNARGPVLPPPAEPNEPAAPDWAFFLDDLPEANWEHPCRYIFVSGNDEDPILSPTPNTLPPSPVANVSLIEIPWSEAS